MIRAIFFDAVGTLLHPQPDAATVYADIGRRHGSRYSAGTIAERLTQAFSRQDELDRAAGWTTNAVREWRRWRDIVGEVLDDIRNPNVCFAELYVHFARPQAWEVRPETEFVLAYLHKRGYRLGMASNYDPRLNEVLAGKPVLERLSPVILSSEVGWRKPAQQFFDEMCREIGEPPENVVFVGDDRVNDYDAAQAAGLEAVLLDPDNVYRGATAVRKLGDLPRVIESLALATMAKIDDGSE
jgi:putative hydrolase of the HAD superfamily